MGPGFFIFFQGETTLGGGGSVIAPTGIISELPVKVVKEVARKVAAYKAKDIPIDEEVAKSISETMVDRWEKEDMLILMALDGIDERLAILRYKETIRQLVVNDDDLALILILMEA